MSNQIALVTGASSGIGRCVSLELSKAGFEVIISSRNTDGLNQTKSLIDDVGGKAHVVQMDISDHKSVKNLFLESQKIGFVDVVVNNAGFGKFDVQSMSNNYPISYWIKLLPINLNLKKRIGETIGYLNMDKLGIRISAGNLWAQGTRPK